MPRAHAAGPARHRLADSRGALSLRLALLAALCLLAAGCYTGTHAYVRPRLTVQADRAVLWRAVDASVRARGLRVLRADESRGYVEALSPVDTSAGVESRERWKFFVRDGRVRVEMRPELHEDPEPGARWVCGTQVCDCYRYAREREQLRDIRRRARALLAGPALPPVPR